MKALANMERIQISNEVVSIKYEIFNILNIQVVGITLYDCLNHFFSKEKIDTPIVLDNKKTIVASRKFNIIKIPQYIIIVLKGEYYG